MYRIVTDYGHPGPPLDDGERFATVEEADKVAQIFAERGKGGVVENCKTGKVEFRFYPYGTAREDPWWKRVKALRHRRGWSQQRLAQEIPCHISSVAQWESGKKLPTGLYRKRLEELEAGAV